MTRQDLQEGLIYTSSVHAWTRVKLCWVKRHLTCIKHNIRRTSLLFFTPSLRRFESVHFESCSLRACQLLAWPSQLLAVFYPWNKLGTLPSNHEGLQLNWNFYQTSYHTLWLRLRALAAVPLHCQLHSRSWTMGFASTPHSSRVTQRPAGSSAPLRLAQCFQLRQTMSTSLIHLRHELLLQLTSRSLFPTKHQTQKVLLLPQSLGFLFPFDARLSQVEGRMQRRESLEHMLETLVLAEMPEQLRVVAPREKLGPWPIWWKTAFSNHDEDTL